MYLIILLGFFFKSPLQSVMIFYGRTDGRTGQDGSYQFLRAAGAPVRRRRGRGPPRHAKIDFFFYSREPFTKIFLKRKPRENLAKTSRKACENLAKTLRKPCENLGKTLRKPRENICYVLR